MNIPLAKSPRFRLTLEFLHYSVLAAVMLWATWLTWPDAFIDFSREIYLPWRVSCGDVLYRDLTYDFGPLSVYTNATLFAVLGRPSVQALFVLNFTFWLATLFVLRTLLRRMARPAAATVAISAFILLFSFNRFMLCGNYNFLAPYSHEITRGFFFSLLSILLLDSSLALLPEGIPATEPAGKPAVTPSAFRLLPSGFLYALVLFSKPELALADSVALAMLFALHAWRRRTLPIAPLLVFSLSAIATIAIVVAPFAISFHSLSRALFHTLLKLYLDCFNPQLSSLPFYKDILGTDHPLPNVLRLLRGAFFATLPFLLARLALPRLRSRQHRILAVIAIAALAAAIGWFAVFSLNAALPLAPLVLLALHWRCKHRGRGKNTKGVLASPLAVAFALFALVLVLKIALNAHIWHYGFVLALPSFCCAILLLIPSASSSLPIANRMEKVSLVTPRAVLATGLLLAFLAAGLHLNVLPVRLFAIRFPVFDASFRTAKSQSRVFNEALAWIRNNTPSDSTLAVLPEGAILNVLSRRPNPTPYVFLDQPACLRFNPDAVLAAYSNAPPDTLILVEKIGEPRFGTEYAQDLMAFLDPLYSPAFTISARSATGESIPYLLIARKN